MKKRMIGLLALMMTAVTVMTGCGSSSMDNKAEVINVDGASVPMGELNFFLRYQQVSMQTMFGAYFGDDFMNQDLEGNGKTYGMTFRDNLVEQLEDYYLVEQHADELGIALSDADHAAAAEAAKAFMKANDSKTLNAMSADEATVTRIMELTKLQQMAYDKVASGVDQNVDENEILQKRVSYVMTSTMGESSADGTVTELTEEQLAEKKAMLERVAEAAKKDGDFAAAAEAEGLSVSETTYGASDYNLNQSVKDAADKLKEGEYSDVVEAESGYYVVRMDSLKDEAATEEQKSIIIGQREQEAYTEWIGQLRDNAAITDNQELIQQLTFDRAFRAKAVN